MTSIIILQGKEINLFIVEIPAKWYSIQILANYPSSDSIYIVPVGSKAVQKKPLAEPELICKLK